MSIFSHSEEVLLAKARQIKAEFLYEAEDVTNGVQEYLRLMGEGLNKHDQAMSMTPTYVTKVPDGSEKGLCLVAELDGTNFRVCSVDLQGYSKYRVTQTKKPIPKALTTGTSKELFSFLAKSIEDFVKRHADIKNQASNTGLKLGLIFPHPVEQVSLNKATLSRWTNGFDVQDTIGNDVCGLLQTEIDALNLRVRVAALVDGTAATLMARSYTSPVRAGTLIGAGFGTCINGAYVEKRSKVTKLQTSSDEKSSSGLMVINTNWSAFDNDMRVLPNTTYDQAVDQQSERRGMQMFEKRVSGVFLGEILRNAILELQGHGLFSLDRDTSIDDSGRLSTPWSIKASTLSTIHGDYSYKYTVTKLLLDTEMGVSNATNADALAIKAVADGIMKRAARLAAVPIAATVLASQAFQEYKQALLEQEEADKVDIGVDGSVFGDYLEFERNFREALRDVEPLVIRAEGLADAVRTGVVSDGNAVGAALTALAA